VSVDDLPQQFIDAVAVGQQLVQFRLAQDTPQGGQGDLGGSLFVVHHLYHGILGIDDLEINYGIHLNGHVILGNHLLGIDGDGLYPDIYLNHPINVGDDDIKIRWFQRNGQIAARCRAPTA